MIFQFSAVLLVALSLVPSLRAAEADVLPEPFPADRYASIKQSSPFALATAAEEKAEPNFARDMFISGVARIGDKNLVSITTQDKTKSFTLMTGDPPVEGIQLLDVKWNKELGKTTVEIEKGGEFGVLQFNEMAIRAPATMTAVPAAQPNRPGPNVQQPGVPRVVNPAAATPGDNNNNRRRRIIRRPSR